jgi:Transglutaminase-like superfamily
VSRLQRLSACLHVSGFEPFTLFLAAVKTLARIATTPPADLWLLGEAFFLLTVSKFALKKVPFSKLADWLKKPGAATKKSHETETILRVQWAIHAVSRRMPSFVCFPQSLAAYSMLKRRGIASVLHYGVSRSASNDLCAHTWISVGDCIVVGGESAEQFTVIQTFP